MRRLEGPAMRPSDGTLGRRRSRRARAAAVDAIRRTAARRSPTARRSGPRPRTSRDPVPLAALAPALAGPLVRAVLADHRPCACSTSDQRLEQVRRRPARPGRIPRRGHTRARTGSVLTGCASGTLLGSVPARVSPREVARALVLAAVPFARGGRSCVCVLVGAVVCAPVPSRGGSEARSRSEPSP